MPSNGDHRSRSPAGSASTQEKASDVLAGPLPKNHPVQFFHAADASDAKAALVRPANWPGNAPKLLQSHGWLEGTLSEAFDPSSYDPAKESSWPLVLPHAGIGWSTKTGQRPGAITSQPMRVQRIRESTQRPPLLSFVFVRWGGTYSKWMDEQEANDGDWGKYGSPPSDEYMTAVVKEGVMAHPALADDKLNLRDVEVLHVFVGSSKDAATLGGLAPKLASTLRGRRRTLWWMLWPAEWQDSGDPDFACYVERHALFRSMRCCEGAGLRSGFPHPADQFEMITSKSWMATLSLHPSAQLPACVLVNKEMVVVDVKRAARDALNGLERVRSMCAGLDVREGDPAWPSEINKDKITKGVVKLGWSWENRFVLVFKSPEQLQSKLTEMMTQEGCTSSYCIVQEWVDFDFEMRLYLLPESNWLPGQPVKPTRIECNEWGGKQEDGPVGTPHGSFRKLSESMALQKWEGDNKAWENAKEQAIERAQFLLSWLVTVNAQPVPMIRMDFMVKRVGPGRARVVFGEYCEMGACCLGWKEGPPTIWKAALDAAVR